MRRRKSSQGLRHETASIIILIVIPRLKSVFKIAAECITNAYQALQRSANSSISLCIGTDGVVERARGGGGVIRRPLADGDCGERGETGDIGPGEMPRDIDLAVGVDFS